METSILPVPQLSDDQKVQMRGLMDRYYANVSPQDFSRDLHKKDWVVLATSGGGVVGFSTQALWDIKMGDQSVRVVFSGDTIVEEVHRNSVGVPFGVARLLGSLYRKQPDEPLYWLLTSKGYKTYRALRVFFKQYFPAQDLEPTLKEQMILERILCSRFNGHLDRDNWVLRAESRQQRLRPRFARIEKAKARHPDVVYFLERNPGYALGDELVCLAQFDPANVHRRIWRKLVEPC